MTDFRRRGFADSVDWNETDTFFALAGEANRVLHGPDGWTGELRYDTLHTEDASICNVSREDGCVCRLLLDHTGLHIPFTGELIATSGIYVNSRVGA